MTNAGDAYTGFHRQTYQSEACRQRAPPRPVIGEKIKFLDQLDRMLESDRKRLADRETRYEDAIRFGKAPGINGTRDFWCRVHKCNHTSPSQRNQDYRQHQNDMVRAQTDASTRQFALAKLSEMQMRVGRLEQSTFSIIASQRLPPPVPAPLHDVEELKLYSVSHGGVAY